MYRHLIVGLAVLVSAATPGCQRPESGLTKGPSAGTDDSVRVGRPAGPRSLPDAQGTRSAGEAEISWDAEGDRRFAEFLREHSGGMVRKAAVGIERRGLLRVELDESVSPDDTLPLTRSLMSGARKDFPGKPIELEVFDPGGQPILTAHYRPDHGVSYQLAKGGNTSEDSRSTADDAPVRAPTSTASGESDGSGVTGADRRFVAWAEEHGRTYLRYVQADLDRNGRLWFGVTSDVRPADLPDLTRSLLEGASKAFPDRDLRATAFDPEGEKIGTAHLDRRGQIRWDR